MKYQSPIYCSDIHFLDNTTYSIFVILNLLLVSIIRFKYELISVSLSQHFNQY